MSKSIKLALASSVLAGVLSFASLAVACPDHDKEATAQTEDKGPAPAHLTTTAFHVNGMHCEGCGDHIREALNKVKGVYKVDVKMADHRVIVSFDADKLSAEKVAKLISDAGYTAAAEA
jgi:copper chaperone CopZ